ncbi:helix-hairpin-helix domain-containing protein [Spirillospora sp. NPDC052269]
MTDNSADNSESAAAPTADAATDAAGTDAAGEIAALTALFEEAGVPASLAPRAAARLGAGAADRLRDDPWRLLRVPGVRPRQADHFARKVLGDAARPDDPRRGRALVAALLAEAAVRGHTVTPLPDVLTSLEKERVADPRRAVEDALDAGEVLALTEEPEFDEEAFDEDADLPEPEESLGLARWALTEEAAAEGFQRLNATAAPLLDDAVVKELRSGLPEDRSLAFTAALRTGVTIWRGTANDLAATAVAVVTAAAGQGVRAAVVTPTDLAAADLAAAHPELPEGTAVGLHRLLDPADEPGTAPGSVLYRRGEQRPFELDLLVLPDASGLDVELCAVLVEACPDGAHLVLCGEPGAAPPAAPGRVLADLEASETVPVVELEPEGPGGPLDELTAAVRGGGLAQVAAPNKEVVIVPAMGEEEAVHRAVQLVTDSIPRVLDIPAGEVQVVALAPAGEAAAGALNAALKAKLNPGPGRFAGFDVGDRIVVASPLPQAAVGETGTIEGARPEGLSIVFAAGTSVVPPASASRLRHGWALPLSLARGARRDAVVAVVAGSALSRPAVATAFGLARRHLSVVQAAGPGLARAVRETGAPERRTRLARLVLG